MKHEKAKRPIGDLTNLSASVRTLWWRTDTLVCQVSAVGFLTDKSVCPPKLPLHFVQTENLCRQLQQPGTIRLFDISDVVSEMNV